MRKANSFLYLMLVMAVALVGCTNKRYNTPKSTATGAAIGAVYGQAIGGDTEGTLLGIALGGLAGAVIGNYEDQRIGTGSV